MGAGLGGTEASAAACRNKNKHRALERALDVARVGQRPHDRRGHVLARDDEARAADALVDAERAEDLDLRTVQEVAIRVGYV